MSKTSKVAAAIALVFASGVATAFAKSTPEAPKLAASAPVVALVPTTATTIPVPVIEAPTPVAVAVVDASTSGLEAPETAAFAPKPARVAPRALPVAPKPAAVAPEPASVLPAVTLVVPIAPVVVPAAPAAPATTATTTAPTLVRPVCTDTSLDHRSPELAGMTGTTMIGAYAQCVAEGGAIDPRHDDINGNGDGDYCGGKIPPGTSSSQFSQAITAQSDCLTELASRDHLWSALKNGRTARQVQRL